MLNIFFQDGTEEALQGLEPEATEKTISIMELLMNGGVGGQVIITVHCLLCNSVFRSNGKQGCLAGYKAILLLLYSLMKRDP
jgi:hypothetical protein